MRFGSDHLPHMQHNLRQDGEEHMVSKVWTGGRPAVPAVGEELVVVAAGADVAGDGLGVIARINQLGSEVTGGHRRAGYPARSLITLPGPGGEYHAVQQQQHHAEPLALSPSSAPLFPQP
jgi:hypothetical protein